MSTHGRVVCAHARCCSNTTRLECGSAAARTCPVLCNSAPLGYAGLLWSALCCWPCRCAPALAWRLLVRVALLLVTHDEGLLVVECVQWHWPLLQRERHLLACDGGGGCSRTCAHHGPLGGLLAPQELQGIIRRQQAECSVLSTGLPPFQTWCSTGRHIGKVLLPASPNTRQTARSVHLLLQSLLAHAVLGPLATARSPPATHCARGRRGTCRLQGKRYDGNKSANASGTQAASRCSALHPIQPSDRACCAPGLPWLQVG